MNQLGESTLSCYDFGRRLLETNDLDPVYVLVHEAGLDPTERSHWLVAYWCFYHVGTASWIAEGMRSGDYYRRLAVAAGSKEYPRSSERRHFRGEAARKSVEWITERTVEVLFSPFNEAGSGGLSAEEVMDYVQEWVGFGPWIAFKVADMLERLGIVRVEFDLGTVMYDSPAKAAQLLWDEHNPGLDSSREPGGVEVWAVEQILSELGSFKAPPRYERLINAQEAETILCKWKSYMGGHYHVGEDVAACRNGLLRYARCRTSQRLFAGGRKGGLW